MFPNNNFATLTRGATFLEMRPGINSRLKAGWETSFRNVPTWDDPEYDVRTAEEHDV